MKLFPIILLLLSGCASPPPKGPLITRTFDKPYDAVWAAIVGEMTSRYPIRIIEKDSGVLEPEQMVLRNGGDYSQHPNIFLGAWGDTRVEISVYAKPENGGTFVRIRTDFARFEYSAFNNWFKCETTGRLETEIMDGIAARL